MSPLVTVSKFPHRIPTTTRILRAQIPPIPLLVWTEFARSGSGLALCGKAGSTFNPWSGASSHLEALAAVHRPPLTPIITPSSLPHVWVKSSAQHVCNAEPYDTETLSEEQLTFASENPL